MFSKQRFQTSVLAVAVVAGLSLTSTLGHAKDVADNPREALAATSSADAYWTNERMRNAKPVPTPKFDAAKLGRAVMLDGTKTSKSSRAFKPKAQVAAAAPGPRLPLSEGGTLANSDVPQSISGNGYPFTTSRVWPNSTVNSWPYRLAGKVFFRDPATGNNFVCSGAIISRRLILTAGHCVYNRAGNYFFTRHVFVPSYDARLTNQPYGIWRRGYAIAPGQWANSSGFPTSSDFAIFAVRDQYIRGATRKIGEYLGWLGWQTYRLHGNHVKQLGYPVNLDRGGRMIQTDGQVYRRSSIAGEIGSAQSGGSSGGPWVQDFGIRPAGQQLINSTGSNRIVGVTSYGPTNFSPWQYVGASVLNNNFVRIRNTACGKAAGNC